MLTEVSLPIDARVLYLTRDLDLIRQQLYEGLQLRYDELGADDLLDDVNTDLITPVWTCFDHHPQDLARNAYAGLIQNGERVFTESALANGSFSAIVSGRRKGTGSSRETAPQAELWSGVKIVVAQSFAPIYERNCINLGLLVCGHDTFTELLRGQVLALEEFTRNYDEMTKSIVAHGGLLNYVKALRSGEVEAPNQLAQPRPMTISEKVLASKALTSQEQPIYVEPGNALICQVDSGYSYEFTTAQVDAFLTENIGPNYELCAPHRLAVFEDHMIFAESVPRLKPFIDKIESMRQLQRDFQQRTGVRDYSAQDGVSPGICHQVAREKLITPGQFVLATDSHTCMGGANNALAIGGGSTEYAALAWSGLTPVVVPQSIRFELNGTLAPNCTAKDLMLVILRDYARDNQTLNRAMEFGGPALKSLSPDERATLCNMATECSARTAICEPDDILLDWIAERRTHDANGQCRSDMVWPDPGAEYEGGVHQINLSSIAPMLAHPGNPQLGIPSDPTNGVPVAEIGTVPVDIAYGGSCTAGKIDDLECYARVCDAELSRGNKVDDSVEFFIQFGSAEVADYARKMGWISLFERAGISVLNPGCGACIGCGPGTSASHEQTTISAVNRNYQGRSGPGRVFLASPLTVAASAFAGKIVAFENHL